MLRRATRGLTEALRSAPSGSAPRRVHVFGIGTAKSGTHSLASLCARSLRAAHEPESARIIDLILGRAAGDVAAREFRKEVARYDRRMWLEVNSSQLNLFLLDELLDLFPQSKFVLTMRHPRSWLDSFINHQLGRPANQKWRAFRDFRFRPQRHPHPEPELALKRRGLYSLDGYLSYWAWHNHEALTSVPPNRLLVVHTDRISSSLEEITAFLGIPRSRLRAEESHAFKAEAKFDVLESIDSAYLDEKIREHCGPLLARFFPGAHS